MKKCIFGFILLAGLCGCILPNHSPSPSITQVDGTSFPATSIVETPLVTVEPVSTETAEGTIVVPSPSGDPTATVFDNSVGTDTPEPTISFPDRPTEIPKATQVLPTPYIIFLYQLQPGTPKPIMNFAHPEAACDWMGVGGQVFDLAGNPVANLIVKLTGDLDGTPLEMIALTGGAIYLGPGGYEFKIADQPIETSGTLWLTLYDNQGKAISESLTFTTYASCDQNFVLINFSQKMIVKNGYKSFLPLVEVSE